MQPFHVQCETCQATFRVRDQRVVGQIHPCPKCGGMVMITPPEETEETGTAGEVGETNAPSVAPVIELAPPLSPAEARGRGVAIAVAIGGLAFVAAATGVILTMGGPEETQPGSKLIAERDADDRKSTEPAPVNPIEQNLESDTVEAPPAETPAPIVPPLPPEPAPRPKPPLPEVDNEQPVVKPTPPSEPPLGAEPEGEGETDQVTTPDIIDPLDFDPASADLILTRGPKKPPSRPVTKAPPKPAASTLLDQRLASARREGQRAADVDHGIAARAAGLKVWSRLGETGQTPPPVPAGDALEIVVPEMELNGWQIDCAVDLLGKLAGSPITLSPAALRQAGVAVNRQVNVAGNGRTVGQLLDTALGPLQLECVERDGSLVVIRRGGDDPHTASYAVNDLISDDAEGLLALVQELLGLEEPAARLTIEEGKLSLAARRSDHYELLVLCERLRKARGLPLRSNYPPELLATRPAAEMLADRLERPARFSFIADTPFSRVVDHWKTAIGAPILVDWQALAAAGIRPQTPITTAARDTTWKEALDAVLTRLGLRWRAVDAGLIEITAAQQDAAAINFYPVENQDEADTLARKLEREGAAATRYDQRSRSLMVRRGQ